MPLSFDAQSVPGKRAIRRLVAALAMMLLAFGAVCSYILLAERDAAKERANNAANSLAAALASEIYRNIESLNLSLDAVVEGMNRPDIAALPSELQRLVLFDRSVSAPQTGAILVLDSEGNIRQNSLGLDPTPLNLADRDYFLFHKRDPDAGTYISQPFVSRVSGEAIVAVSRRLSDADGAFNGVVVGSLRLSYLKELFARVTLSAASNITLSSTEGVMLMRWPFRPEYIGQNIKQVDLYEELRRASVVNFEATSAGDGIRRLISYSRVGDLPFVVGIGQPTSEVYAAWRQYAFLVALAILIMVGVTTGLTLYLAREFRRRDHAEMQLAALATTDALTGLKNRRHLDKTMAAEWQRARRERATLALIMIDVDFFKDYNDRLGHQCGDQVLKAVGEAMAQTVRSGVDVAARFGGDEFAVLLPGTAAASAAKVARRIRAVFDELCRKHNMAALGLSIGVAALPCTPGKAPSDLLVAADQALYRAKARGRGRIELATSEAGVLPKRANLHAAA